MRESILAPRNELEQAIAGVWSRVLGVEQVGVDDNFFELGGHSLIAIELASQIRSLLGVNFLAADVARRPTVASQAEGIAQALLDSLAKYGEP